MKSSPLPKQSVAAEAGARPASATNGWVVSAGFVAFLASLWLVRMLKMQNTVLAAVICMGLTALVNFIFDVSCLKVHRRASTGLEWPRFSPSIRRVAVKFIGLLGSMGFIGILYWLFPEYHGDFYLPYWKLLEMILPWWLVFAIPYFYFVDAKQSEPHDGYYQAGLAVLFQFNRINGALLMQQALGWLVKGFFMALMFCYFTSDLNKFIFFDFSTEQGFRGIYDFGYYFVFLADVAVACMGYLISLRFFDTHLRMAEPTMRGWVAALACYQPFWAVLSRQYLDYSRDFAWGAWLQDKYWLYCIWGSAILMLYAVYLWATVIFGCRFSNLTHRGIITNGPYRWTKHPAYISKNLAYWLTFVPFIISESVADSLRRCALLLLLNGIYFVRARAEESMLGQDVVYREYAGWMRKNGLFRRLGRVLPWAAKK